ncbi:unnamed protein product [Rotaria socialis]|uniref:Uncharacterized protein n=1 Tax=Rotaria socialis TaxID=392032 RepID=A0A820CEJ3_9BILA|nr:unnamed protein product [Rotaria socialis]CAF4216323.1 unnamed protein product [Rotaria socialis]
MATASATIRQVVPSIIQPQLSPWRQKFPAVLSGILASVQFVVAIIIIGCEIGSILIDIITVTIYVGLWAGLFFLVASFSQSSSCIACFFTTSTCNSTGSSRGIFYSASNFNNIKIPLIKGQLGAGCVMIVLCLIQIIIYIITAFRVNQVKNSPTVHPTVPSPLPVVPTGPDGMIIAPPIMNVRTQRAGSPLYHRPTMVIENGDGRSNDLTCPTCATTMSVIVRKKEP